MSGRLHKPLTSDTTSTIRPVNKFDFQPANKYSLLDEVFGTENLIKIDTLGAEIDALDAAIEADWRATEHLRYQSWSRPPEVPASTHLKDRLAVANLAQEYKFRVVQAAARTIRWKGPLPDLDTILDHIEYRHSGGRARYEWHRWRQVMKYHALAEAVVPRLNAIVEHISPFDLSLACASEQELRELSQVAQVQLIVHGRTECSPDELPDEPPEGAPDDLRAIDYRTTLRKLRKRARRADAHLSWILGATGGRKAWKLPAFASNYAVARYQTMQTSAKEFASKHHIYDGRKAILLATTIAASKMARRSELCAMVMGMHDGARKRGLTPLFVTLTLPSEFHPNPSKGANKYDPSISPKDAADHMQRGWHRILATLAKRDVPIMGVWTVEPHTDGCPHRHAVLWCRPEDIAAVEDAVKTHFPGEHQTEIREITEDGKASVTSYVLTYTLKTLAEEDAPVEGRVNDDEDHLNQWTRFRAWAQSLGIRRFGLIGLPRDFRGKWRGLHGLKDQPEDPQTRGIWRALKKGQWSTAMARMGVFAAFDADAAPADADRSEQDRRDDERGQALKLVYRERVTRYGDTRKEVIGCVNESTGNETIWKTKEWTIINDDELARINGDDANELSVNAVALTDSSPSRLVAEPPAGHPPPSKVPKSHQMLIEYYRRWWPDSPKLLELLAEYGMAA